jgi:phage terminase large subunit-like protein
MASRANASLIELLASLSEAERAEALDGFTEAEIESLLWDWDANARPNQKRPKGDWRYWLVLAGRGFGKTRTGAETVRQWVEEGYRIIHLVAPTSADARDVMVQGESGLVNCFPPGHRPLYEPSKRLITFHNGAIARTFSADEPERLRGPQCEAFWADELCAWRFPEEAWDNLSFGFRLGSDPRGVITTTPKPIKQLKDLMTHPSCVVTRASTYENRVNLAPGFFEDVIRRYEGTRLGRQELNAEVLEDVPGALWTRQLIEASRVGIGHVKVDTFVRVVVAIDPAVSASDVSDETGIVIAALTRSGHVFVLDDLTCKESPLTWAKIAVNAYVSRRADRIVGEVNNGGDLVEANIRAVAPNVPYRAVRASRGKYVRAEPIAALYEQARVHHVGTFPLLEDQMCSFVPGTDQKSPDRMDALVWAVTELLIDMDQQPSIQPLGRRVTISQF